MINTDLENASKIMIGSLEAEAIYVGNNLIWSSVPYDAEIEYLEGTGTQWIDTGIIPTINTKSQIKFCNLNTTGAVIFGYNTGDDHIDYRLFNYSSNLYFDIPGNVSNREGNRLISNNYKINTNSIYELELGNFYVKDLTTNNIIVNLTPCDNFGEINNSITLNAGWESYSTYVISSNKWYYVKIYENNTLILNLIPVRVGQIGYMYDKVSGLLLGNSGTGDFVLGPDVCLLSEFLELEYLESDGNQYINTHLEIGSCDFKITTWLNISFGFIHDGNPSGTFITADTTNRTDSIWYEYDGYHNGVINNVSLSSNTKISYDMLNGLFINDIKVASFLSVVKFETISGHGMPIGTKYNFNTNSFITVTRNIHIILRRYVIEKSGTTVMDLIPVKRISDDTLGMYDLISGTFFTNSGTGTFIAGPNISD